MAQHYSLYTTGSRIWIRDKERWIGAVVEEDCDGKTLTYKRDDDGTLKVISSTPLLLPHLRNPDILIGLNDLTSLSFLHEPGVLYNLKYRFTEMKAIYTYCGIVLVAINPYQKLGIYGVETMWTYRGHAIGELEPHIFAVAEEAFREMERASLDQSIIVSGESGAGKTVSAKYAMAYFATVGGAESATNIERKVLASQPIMEAIGNAKTIRNDNSSRFGKYVQLQFSSTFSIIGATMRTYLLEKSRVVFQAPEERNYHIFYQILASENEEVSDLFLSPTSFNYAKTATVNDKRQFSETLESMKSLGFGIDDRRNYFRLLAAILHLGNVVFVPQDDDSCVIEMPSTPITILCNLLSISASEITKWLTFRRIQTVGEETLKPMTVAEAEFSRDALAKLLYQLSFNWIVDRVNETLKSEEKCFKSIGVLDIYGFEIFEVNSFEQFCINYANEKLQQQFNSHMFKLDQEEYAKESIDWTFIDFYDNQPCIDLIETKLGILGLLDDETKMPAASDRSWTLKLYKECAKYRHFHIPKRADGEEFSVAHFASEVTYTSSGFLEKNRDSVLLDQIETVKKSTNPFIASIVSIDTLAAKKKTVSTTFRASLNFLLTSLDATTPHYIRCIKPNDDKLPFEFDDSRALQQLLACGVLETVRIQASGYPTRWTYLDFAIRYRVLCKSTVIKRNDHKTTSIRILRKQIIDSTTYKLGTTKIFFRSGVLAFLEKIRSAKFQSSMVLIQKTVRGWLGRKRYAKLQESRAMLKSYDKVDLTHLGILEADNLKKKEQIEKLLKQLIGFNNLKQHTDIYVNMLQIENALLRKTLYDSTLDILKLHDVEMQYEQLQLNYRKLLLSNSPTDDVTRLVKAQTEELGLKREENLILRSLLSTGSNDRDIITTLEQQLTTEKLKVKQLQEEVKRLREYAENDDESSYDMDTYDFSSTRMLDNLMTSHTGSVVQLMSGRTENASGLLRYDPAVEHRILEMIMNLKPSLALTLDPPTLPAYIIFMMIKHIDSINDEARLGLLFKGFVKMSMEVIQKRNQLEYYFLWLSNVLRLLHTLKQYSGEPVFAKENTAKQNEQCLVNFDLIDFRKCVSDISLRFYVGVIKNIEDKIQPLIVSAILGSSSELSSVNVTSQDKSMNQLKKELTVNYDLLVKFHVDPEVIVQIFKQVFYYLMATSMNNLLLRKALCNWSSGMQIRYNISMLEDWCRSKKLDSVISILNPIIQASQLLQANKSEKDVDFICQICDDLTLGQVIQILHLFTADEDEVRISSSFIKKVEERLSKRSTGTNTSEQLLIDTKHLLKVKFPYHPSRFVLEDLDIPECLAINGLVKKL